MQNKMLGGILLVAGTSIGAAALALPIVTSNLGIMGAFGAFLFSWLIMYFAGMLVLDVSLACKKVDSFISMTQQTLGKQCHLPVAILYITLLYALLAAYFRGGADLVHSIDMMQQVTLPHWCEPLPLVFVTAVAVYRGADWVDGLNRLLVLISNTSMRMK